MTPTVPSPLKRIQQWFPSLDVTGFLVTSPPTTEYNCIAWATGDTERWWQPAPEWGYFWPIDPDREGGLTLAALVAAYRAVGFEACDRIESEDGAEVVALYRNGERWTHAARRLDGGGWTSKLGQWEDIRHAAPECLCGPQQYGELACYMKRPAPPRTAGPDPTPLDPNAVLPPSDDGDSTEREDPAA